MVNRRDTAFARTAIASRLSWQFDVLNSGICGSHIEMIIGKAFGIATGSETKRTRVEHPFVDRH